jgi:hypothetical protein
MKREQYETIATLLLYLTLTNEYNIYILYYIFLRE